jgi:uncharacterized protein (TIGR00290 family)
MPDKIILSWSGGKDSAMALARLIYNGGCQVEGLFTSYNRDNSKVNLHGIPKELIREQAASLKLDLYELPLPPAASNEEYEAAHLSLFENLKAKGIDAIAYGDLFVQEIRDYRDRLSEKAGISFIYPLWGEDTSRLAPEIIERGFKAVVISIDAEKLPGNMLGRPYDDNFIKDLPENNDYCGENGEFHTFVYDGPIFSRAIPYQLGDRYEEDYRPAVNMQMKYMDILPVPDSSQDS